MPENDIYSEIPELDDAQDAVIAEETEPEQLSLSLPGDDNEQPEKMDAAETLEEAEPADATVYNKEKPRRIDSRFEFIELLILTLAAVFIFTTFICRHSIVDGNSMINTLHDRDCLITSKFLYTPKQYDIVVIEDHSTGIDHPLVKRIIAVGGDRVQVTKDGVYVNGELTREDFVCIDNCTGKGDDVYDPKSFVVPDGHIYVLGDHRDNSSDSRTFGTVSVDSIIGKVLFRFYPFSDFGSVYTEEK